MADAATDDDTIRGTASDNVIDGLADNVQVGGGGGDELDVSYFGAWAIGPIASYHAEWLTHRVVSAVQ